MRESELVKVSIKGFMSPDHYISYNLSLYSSKRQLNEFFKLSEEMRKTVGEVLFISLFFSFGSSVAILVLRHQLFCTKRKSQLMDYF